MIRYKTENKYHNNKITFNGITFDSKKEFFRYKMLLSIQDKGLIKDLQMQVPFELIPKFKYNNEAIRSVVYYADFVYCDCKTNEIIVEDVKSEVTRKEKTYILKKKMFLYKYKDKFVFKEVV